MKRIYRTGGLLGAITLGLLCPWLHGMQFLVQYLLMGMLFFVFLRVHAPLHATHRSHFLLLAWNIAVAPLAYEVVTLCGGCHDLALAAFLAGLSPTGTAAPVVMGFLEGNIEYTVMSFLITTFSITFIIPILLPPFLGTATPGLSVAIFHQVAGIVFLPLVLALILRKTVPSSRRWSTYPAIQNLSLGLWMGTLSLMVANASFFIQQHETSYWFLFEVLVTTAIVCLLNFTVGYFLSRKYHHESSQSLGQKNTAITFYVAVTYANPAVALGPCTYILWHNLWNAIQMGTHRSAEPPKRETPAEENA